MRKLLPSLFLTYLCLVSSLFGGNYSFIGGTDKNPLEYAPGETITFTVTVLEDGLPTEGVPLHWWREGDDHISQEGEAISSQNGQFVYQTSIETPGFALLRVCVPLSDGSYPLGEAEYFSGSAGTRLNELEGNAEPTDFDVFWARQKERLATVPFRSQEVEVPNDREGVVCYDVKVDCLGMPVSGYLTLPKNSVEKSLPAHLYLNGYGVSPANRWRWAGKNELAFDINAHGIENGKPVEFYQNLRETTLKDYGFSKEENTDPEQSYWNGVALRVMRALEYLKSRPEWDGTNLIVSGGSQGGFQTILAAGLDSDVTLAKPSITWLCDLSGSALNHRIPSCFFPEWTEGLAYYDSVNHAKRIRCRVEISAGLGDPICPPAGQVILYNHISSPVKLVFMQGKTHGYEPADRQIFSLEKNQ